LLRSCHQMRTKKKWSDNQPCRPFGRRRGEIGPEKRYHYRESRGGKRKKSNNSVAGIPREKRGVCKKKVEIVGGKRLCKGGKIKLEN